MTDHFTNANIAWNAGDLYRAFRLFLAGAKAGCGGCQNNLGYFYDAGIGVAQNLDKAFDWYLRACEESRSCSGASNLAIIFRDAGDLHNARKYFRLSVAFCSPSSLDYLADLELKTGATKTAEKLLRQLLACDRNTVFPVVRERAQRKLRRLLKKKDLENRPD